MAQPPSDSVSSLCFSPKANYLVATSWDNQVCAQTPICLAACSVSLSTFFFFSFEFLCGILVLSNTYCIIVVTMLGDYAERECCCQYTQGVNIPWPTSNKFKFVVVFLTCLSLVWRGKNYTCILLQGFVLNLEGWWDNCLLWRLRQASEDVAFRWATSDSGHAWCAHQRGCLDPRDEPFGHRKLGQDLEVIYNFLS